MPSPASRLGKIQELLILSILVHRVVTNTILIVAGDVSPTRTEEPITDIGVEDNSLKAPARKAFAEKLVLEVATTHDIVIALTPKAPIVTSEMR